MENQIISINLVPNMSTPAVVRVSQYDVGRPLVFKVYDGTSPADLTGVTAVIEGTKKSGLGFSESGTVSGNTVTLDTTLAMTQEDGSIPAEIRFTKTGEDVGTANFILAVEKSPHLEGTTDGTTETMADLQSQLDALDERVEALEDGGGGGLTDAIKSALLQIAQKVAYIDEHGQTYYDALYNALYPPAELVSISAVYTQSGTVYDTDSLDTLRSDLVVTAHYENGTSAVVTTYTLSGTLTEGTSTITVSYAGLTDTFDVTVSIALPSGYTAYDFVQNIQTGNNCAVSTGLDYVYGSSDYEHELVFTLVTGGSTGGIFGLRATTGTSNNSITAWINGDGTSNLAINVANTDTGYTLTASKVDKNTLRITHESGNTKVYFNDSIAINAADVSFTVSARNYFHIFKALTASNTSSGSTSSKMKVYGYSVKNIATGDYVARMLPCVEDSTSNAGFYDIVRNTFYTSSSTGQLQAGND